MTAVTITVEVDPWVWLGRIYEQLAELGAVVPTNRGADLSAREATAMAELEEGRLVLLRRLVDERQRGSG